MDPSPDFFSGLFTPCHVLELLWKLMSSYSASTAKTDLFLEVCLQLHFCHRLL